MAEQAPERQRGSNNRLVRVRALIAEYQPDAAQRGLAVLAERHGYPRGLFERIYKRDDLTYQKAPPSSDVLTMMAYALGCRVGKLAWAFWADLNPDLVDPQTDRLMNIWCDLDREEREDTLRTIAHDD